MDDLPPPPPPLEEENNDSMNHEVEGPTVESKTSYSKHSYGNSMDDDGDLRNAVAHRRTIGYSMDLAAEEEDEAGLVDGLFAVERRRPSHRINKNIRDIVKAQQDEEEAAEEKRTGVPSQKKKANVKNKGMVFKDKVLSSMKVDQVVTLVENSLFSNESVARAWGWSPPANSVIICGPPRCGNGSIVSILHMLSVGGESDSVTNLSEDDVPLIESKAQDHKEAIFRSRQEPRRFSIFRTHMSGQLAESRIMAQQKAKWIYLLRDPYDVRLSFYRYLEEMWEEDRLESQQHFKDCFNAEDFALLPITSCRMKTESPDTHLEENYAKWIDFIENPNILLICYEELLFDPKKMIRKIAKFTNSDCPPDLIEATLKRMKIEKIKKSYEKFHKFDLETLLLGDGACSISLKTTLALDELWFKHVLTAHPKIRNYDALYYAVTGNPHPFPDVSIAIEAEQKQFFKGKRKTLAKARSVKDYQTSTTARSTANASQLTVSIVNTPSDMKVINEKLAKEEEDSKASSCCTIL